MTIKSITDIMAQDAGSWAIIIIIFTTIIQISPIKLDPWSYILSWFGKQINKDIMERVEILDKKLDQHIKESEERDLRKRRTTILDFASSLMAGRNYHKEEFEFMLSECDSYLMYCNNNNILNGVAETSIGEIKRVYQEHLRDNSFLKEG